MTRLHHPPTRLICLAVLSVLVLTSARIAQAGVVLTDGNSTVNIDPSGSDPVIGVNQWQVNGVNMLYQQWVWYRIGDDPTGQHSIDTNGDLVVNQFDPADVKLSYSNTLINASVQYTLAGGAAGQVASDLGELVNLTNTSSATYTIHFCQYSDIDLGGCANNKLQHDSVTLITSKAVRNNRPRL
jgi:hypothetical protein